MHKVQKKKKSWILHILLILYPPMDRLHHHKFRAWSTIMKINLRMKDKFIRQH